MPVGPVHWGSYPGETLEKVMAVLLSQDHPSTMRRTPASGDGGVDVMVPVDDGWDIYQVKGFVGRLSEGSRKSQIQDSLETLFKDPRLGDKPVKRWLLTVPIDPTPDEQAWFEGLVQDLPFPGEWRGEVFWHTAAANHPHVIDYYFENGKARLELAASTLLGAHEAVHLPLTPESVGGHLERLRETLNDQHPHYRYEFATGLDAYGANIPTGTVYRTDRRMADGTRLSIFLVARHDHATTDCPIGLEATITVVDEKLGIDLREEIASFEMYGTGFEIPAPALDLTIDVAGELGGRFEGAGGTVGPALTSSAPDRTRLEVDSDADEAPTVLELETISATSGPIGGGIEVTGRDASGAFEAAFRVARHADGRTEVNIRLTFDGNLAGTPASRVLPAVEFASRLEAGATIRWRPEFGAQVLLEHVLAEDIELCPSVLAETLRNLDEVQRHVAGTVPFPKDFDRESVRAIHEAAELVRHGEIEGNWEAVNLTLKEGVDREVFLAQLTADSAVELRGMWALEVDGEVFDIGQVSRVLRTVKPADPQPEDTGVVQLIPGDDRSFKTVRTDT